MKPGDVAMALLGVPLIFFGFCFFIEYTNMTAFSSGADEWKNLHPILHSFWFGFAGCAVALAFMLAYCLVMFADANEKGTS